MVQPLAVTWRPEGSSTSRTRRVADVGVELPTRCRVAYVLHSDEGESHFEGTLRYDDDRHDYVLTKLETVPGVREKRPLTNAPVAFPPAPYTLWKNESLSWTDAEGRKWAGMVSRGDVRRRGARTYAWDVDANPATAAACRRGMIVGHNWMGNDLGGRGTWFVKLDDDSKEDDSDDASSRGQREEPQQREKQQGSSDSNEADSSSDGKEHTRRVVSAPELRAALDLYHAIECRRRAPELSATARDAGWATRESRSTGEHYFVLMGENHTTTLAQQRQQPTRSQWEHPDVNDPVACPGSCGCPGHRNKAHVDAHAERAARKRALMSSVEAKWREFVSTSNTSHDSYYEWCRARCAENYPGIDAAGTSASNRARAREDYVEAVLDLMRDYDHVPSDSEFSVPGDDDDDDDSNLDDDDDDSRDDWGDRRGPGSSSARLPYLSRGFSCGAAKKRKVEKLVREGIEAFLESPGVASRILHQDGTNRTRSGAVFGGSRTNA